MASNSLSLGKDNLSLVLIVAGIVVVIYFLYGYTKQGDQIEPVKIEEFFEDSVTTGPANSVPDETGQFDAMPEPEPPVVNEAGNGAGNEAGNEASVQPAEALGMNEKPRGVDYLSNDGVAPGQVPNECYPKDVLSSADLLPGDANSVWAKVNPLGQGSLGDQNYLNSGYHFGINTVGQTLRNASYDLRSEFPNPQVAVSPWMQTTIEPDINKRPFEIGSSA